MAPTIFQTMAALFICAATTGSSYTFGIYSKALKAQFSLPQDKLETISVACFCCGFFTWIPGLINDWIGPRRTIMLGATTQGGSFLMFWAFAQKHIPLPTGGMGEANWAVLVLSLFSITQFFGTAS